MAGGESFGITLLGADVSASRAVEALGRACDHTARRLASLGLTGAKLAGGLLGGAQAAATLGQVLTQAGAGAGVLAPAALAAAQGLGVLRLVSDEASRQLAQLKPEFDGIKTSAAEAFRPGFADALDTFATNLPVVREGVRQTAEVFGELAAEAAEVFSGEAFRADLARTMEVNAEATRNFGRAGISLAGAFWDVAQAGREVFLEISRTTAGWAQQLATWVEAKRESGELEAAIRRGVQTVADLGATLVNFGVGIRALFSGIIDDNADLTGGIRGASEAFREWAEGVGSSQVAEVFDRVRAAGAAAFELVNAGIGAFLAGWAGLPGPDDPFLAMIATFGEQAREAWAVVGGQLLPALRDLALVLAAELGPPLQEVAGVIRGVLLAALSELARIIEENLVPFVRDNFAPMWRDVLLPALTAVGEFIRDTLVPKLGEMASILIDQLGPALDDLRTALVENEEELRVLWENATLAASAILDFLVAALQECGPALTVVTTLAAGLIDVLADLVVANLEVARATADMALAAISNFRACFNAAADAVSGILGVWAQLPGPLGEPFRQAKEKVEEFRRGVNESMGGAEERIRGARDRINEYLKGIQDKTVVITIEQRIKTLNDEFFNPPRRQAGGPARAGTPYLVGEAGPELFVPDRPGRVVDAGSTRRLLAASGPGGRQAAGRGAAATVNVSLTLNLPNALSFDRRALELAAPYLRDAIANDSGSNGRRSGL